MRFTYRVLFGLILGFVGVPGARGFGGNDACPAAALGVLIADGFDNGTTVGMNGNFGPPSGCPLPCGSYGSPSGKDVIYEFMVGMPGTWVFELCATSPAWDNSIQIRTGGSCPGSSCVAANADGCEADCAAPYQARVEAALDVGTVYYVIVDSWSVVHPGAAFRLQWSAPNPCGNGMIEAGEQCDDGNQVDGDGCSSACQLEPPIHDDCAGAQVISAESHLFDLTAATLDTTAPPPCDANMLNDVWFRYTPNCTGAATIATCDALGTDTILQVYEGCACAGLVELGGEACADDNCGGGPGYSSSVTLGVTAGVCLSIRLGGSNGGMPSGVLDVSCAASICGNSLVEFGEQCDDGNVLPGDGCNVVCQFEPPANDLCANALAITSVPFVDADVTWGGATSDRVVECNLGPDETEFGVWYRYTAPADCEAVVDRVPDVGTADTVAAIFAGKSCGALSEVACSDDESSTFLLDSGESYWILVGAWANDVEPPGSTLTISFDCSVPGCGDGVLQMPEECDDMNLADGDGCSSFCRLEGACCFADGQCSDLLGEVACTTAGGTFMGGGSVCLPNLCPSCGNGFVDPMEACDDGNQVGGDGCSANCEHEGACCNGASCSLLSASGCDVAGGTYEGDGVACSGQCGLGACCVNGICGLATMVSCTGVFQGVGTTCNPDPCPAVCGNGEVESPEECDDSNTIPGDGCDGQCMTEGVACTSDVTCVMLDDDVCTCDRCVNQLCMSTSIRYGNVTCTGPATPNLDDILCVLAGFSSFAACPNADVAPPCTGDNVINLDDILRVLAAFTGVDPCGCPS